MADFATRTDVETSYGGSSLPGSTARTDSLLSIASARLRILLPGLAEAVENDDDLALLAKDVVVQAVIRRLPLGEGGQTVQSETQTAGPWQYTRRFTEDRSETFADDDLALLREALSRATVDLTTHSGAGTIRLGRPDWTMG